MFKVNIYKTSQFAVDANFIDDYLQIQTPTTMFSVNSTGSTVTPTSTVTLYQNGSQFTYGQSGKSCRFARIGYKPSLFPEGFYISNSSGTIVVGSTNPVSGTKLDWFMVQNDPQYSTYDIYFFRYPLNSKVAAFLVPNGYAPPDPLDNARQLVVDPTTNDLTMDYWPGTVNFTFFEIIRGVGVSSIPDELNYAGTIYVFFANYKI